MTRVVAGNRGINNETYQSPHRAVKSMPVVPSELGVGSVERRVTVGLGLLDTILSPVLSVYACSSFGRRIA